MRRILSFLAVASAIACSGSNAPVSSTTTAHKRPDYAPPASENAVQGVSGAGAVPAADDATERIAFVKAGAIWIMKPDGGAALRITARQAGTRDEGPQISPFGDQVAFASNRDGAWKIYVAPVDGSTARAVTDGSDGG